MTIINICAIKNLVKEKSFEEVKQISEISKLRVREQSNGNDDLKSLYLLVGEENANNELSVQSNGIILEKNTNKVVCMSQNKFKVIHSRLDASIKPSNASFEYCEDGTVVRLYSYKNIWYTATTKCIDATHSYWSSERTFDEMFWEVFGKENADTLNRSYTYVFVLIHAENRIVVDIKENCLVYINRIHNDSMQEDNINIFNEHKDVKCTESVVVEGNKTFQDYYKSSKRGLIIKMYNESSDTFDIYQYDFLEYSRVKEIRGNTPLIRMRYIELLQDEKSLKILEENYKDHMLLFAMIKHQMCNLYKEIHQLYFQSHIKHTFNVTKTHKYYRTLRQLHGIYKTTGNPITLSEVKSKVDSLDKNVIRKFLNWV